MTAPDFIIELFCQVDEQMAAVPTPVPSTTNVGSQVPAVRVE